MSHDDDDMPAGEPTKRFREFDCPECTANNPIDDGFTAGDEIRCLYCGIEFKVSIADGKLRLREV